MRGCDFSIEFRQDAGTMMDLAKRAITQAGGTVTVEGSKATFGLSTGVGRIRGSYSISGSMLTVIITDKPVWVGCNRIENEIRKHLQN